MDVNKRHGLNYLSIQKTGYLAANWEAVKASWRKGMLPRGSDARNKLEKSYKNCYKVHMGLQWRNARKADTEKVPSQRIMYESKELGHIFQCH